MHPYIDKGAFQLCEDEEVLTLDFRYAYPYYLYRVPTLETMVVRPGEAQQTAEPKRRTRGRLIPALLLILIALAVVAVVLWTLHGR